MRHANRRIALPNPVRQYSAFLHKGFLRYLKWYVGRHFHSVLVSSTGLPRIPADKPLIIYSNHPSWWDPLVFILIGGALFPERRGFGPMESRSLRRYAILERLGVFGVELASARGGVTFMVQGKRILSDPTSILWLTAEGAFTDVRQRPVRLQPGLGHLAWMSRNIVVMPLAVEYCFWNESHPEVLCRFGEPIDIDDRGGTQPTAAGWTDVFERALVRTMDQLTEESVQRNPAHFRSVLKGSTGIGGLYDVWRRLQAWSCGRSFDPSHEQSK